MTPTEMNEMNLRIAESLEPKPVLNKKGRKTNG